jgi:hypothetical protein
VSPLKETREKESEYWHAKALELACSFLPSECPLLNHILISYQKHHSPSHQTIQEEGQNADKLQVIRPLMGIESNKFQPIVRVLEDVKVQISPCHISPLSKKLYEYYNRSPIKKENFFSAVDQS